ncbi:MAG: glycosyltransferase family 2 protein [Ferruginibacter sp.]|nr:glycosyltransferase family 2 protein [Ferruginibacter sp.]
MEKVIALVVSYNRQALLSVCINALRNQSRKPDAILVINNGSTDNTEEWLKSQPDIIYITQENEGSGGGFNTGITWAHKNGYSWTWCMDDDGYPKENALEALLEIETPQRSLLNCAVINKENKKSFVWNTNNYQTIDDVKEPLIKGIGHPFNGTLIHRSIVEKVGVPRSSLFLWGDETEYYYRIVNKHQIPVYTVSRSIHYHPAAAFSYKNDWEFKSSWKMYFYVRNRLHIHKAKFSNKPVAITHYLFFIIAFAGTIMLYQKTDKIKKLRFLSWPLAHAFKNDYSVTPAVILNKLDQQQSGAYHFSLITAVRNLYHALFIPAAPGRSKTATA